MLEQFQIRGFMLTKSQITRKVFFEPVPEV
jgi:hypothetical protein